jgi:hypothetical protein
VDVFVWTKKFINQTGNAICNNCPATMENNKCDGYKTTNPQAFQME